MASYIRRLLFPTPPGRPPPPIIPKVDGHPLKKPILYPWEIAVVVVGSALFIAFVIMVLARYIRRRNLSSDDSRSRNLEDNPPILLDTQVEDFIDEEQGPQLDHPIWYIRTVGLDRSVIEAITVFKYKAGEGLIEGTECSVCLVEFGEDESLRLLPKCSHAFHVRCIDTWLQSHTNCPLCRAPVVRAISPEPHSLEIPTPVGSTSNGPVVQENLPDGGISAVYSNLSFARVGAAVDDENGIEDSNFGSSRIEDAGKVRSLLGPMKHQLGVVSDLGDCSRIVAEKIERKRRSCSMDSHTPAEIYHALGVATCNRVGASSQRQALEMNSIPSINNARPGGSGSSSLYRLAKSCSSRVTLPMKPASGWFHQMEMAGSSSNDHQTLQRHDQHYPPSL